MVCVFRFQKLDAWRYFFAKLALQMFLLHSKVGRFLPKLLVTLSSSVPYQCLQKLFSDQSSKDKQNKMWEDQLCDLNCVNKHFLIKFHKVHRHKHRHRRRSRPLKTRTIVS
jgi:hypothetical protein